MLMKRVFLIIVCSVIVWTSGCVKEESNPNVGSIPAGALSPLESIGFDLGGVNVEIEIAFSQDEQAQGLMYRESMPENHGMLFVNREPRYLSFWMKNTRIPLSIAYIREDGVIGNIEKMKPQVGTLEPAERYHSKYQSLYALEMNVGWFEQHGLKAGDRIALPSQEIERVIANKKSK